MSIWKCADCGDELVRNLDDEQSEEWARRHIQRHRDMHGRQLLEHGGDKKSMRRAVRNPALHAVLNNTFRSEK